MSTPHPDSLGTKTPYGFNQISADDVVERLSEFVLIDVREANEHTGPLGHIDGAKLQPMGSVPAVSVDWDKNAAYLLICRSGNRSGQIGAFLAKQGFSSLFNLDGGMMNWNNKNYPVAK